MEDPVKAFDWQRIAIDKFEWTFLGEVAFRTIFMFLILLAALTLSGKREVRQLSIYELVLVIGLGSAAGDPMFYHDVPLTLAVVVFVVIMGCYKLITFISDRNKKVRELLEGKPVYIIENGCVLTRNFDRQDLGLDELFSDLRVAGIEQLGQVRLAILEANGQLSIFQFKEEDVRPGLPILPKVYDTCSTSLPTPGLYACCGCGQVETVSKPTDRLVCKNCDLTAWVKAVSGE